jgi:hypothetical protein
VNDEFSRGFNDETARHIAPHRDRFWGSAQLPMQDLDLAAAELTRAVRDLGLKSCSIGYALGGGRTLSDLSARTSSRRSRSSTSPILLHPVALGQDLDLPAAGGERLMRRSACSAPPNNGAAARASCVAPRRSTKRAYEVRAGS